MTTVSPALEDLTRRILNLEAARTKSTETQVDVVVQICATLQAPLSRLTGRAGFSSLLSRALVLAKAEVPAISAVQIQPDGSLAGFDEIQQDHAGTLEQGRVALVANLLGLLATFIGESLTRQLAQNAWPDAFIEKTDFKEEEKP